MITARLEGKPEWNQHWFSLTCGPRLVKPGKIWLSPQSEGFRDPHVLNLADRTAIGFPANRQQLFLISSGSDTPIKIINIFFRSQS